MSVRALTRSPWLGTRACPTTLWLRKGRLAATTHLRKKRNTAKRPTVFRLFVPDRPAIGSLRSTESRGDQAGKERERERENGIERRRGRRCSWDRFEQKGAGPDRSTAAPSYQSPGATGLSPLLSSPLLSSPLLSSSLLFANFSSSASFFRSFAGELRIRGSRFRASRAHCPSVSTTINRFASNPPSRRTDGKVSAVWSRYADTL